MEKNTSVFQRILELGIVLALIVIVLGAYTRLSDAGLGCPDWPGCYGKVTVPDEVIGDKFQRPLESVKAWKEMIHRYVAGSLGLLIILVLFMVMKKAPKIKQSIWLPIVLLCVVILQALLGMWTVTLLLSPLIVTAHLIGGLTTLSILWWLLLNQKQKNGYFTFSVFFKVASVIALIAIVLQILLGGWTSTNYAALACGVDFPTCASKWWPEMDFANGFDLSHKPNVNYEFGILDSPARTAIQMMHRIGALIVFIYLSGFALIFFKKNKKIASILILFLVLQVTLGISNVVFALPLLIAIFHNFIATLLLLTVLAINHIVFSKSPIN